MIYNNGDIALLICFLYSCYNFIKFIYTKTVSIIQSSLDKQDEDLCDAFCYEFGWISYLSKIKHLLKNIEWLYKII